MPASGARPVDADLAAWLTLAHGAGVGRVSARRLLAAFGSASAAMNAPPSAWAAVLGKRTEPSTALDEADALAMVERSSAWLAGSPSRRIVTLADPDYPAALLQTADPPLLLYLEGRVDVLAQPMLAIVGSRHATPQGLETARVFARELAAAGWCVVSGLAAGIDGAAHAGAIETGSTIAVVGTGLDDVYPRRHRALARQVAAHGLVVSELPLGAPPLAAHFPQRNRIIAGLAAGTLVVEAVLQSGSLITARLAAEAGREVFAIPGSIHSPHARGCHALLRQGAKLVESIDDVLEELRAMQTPPTSVGAEPSDLVGPEAEAIRPADDPVMRALGHDPAGLDALIGRCGWPAPELLARLLELEFEGVVARLPGGLYQRIQRG